MVPRTVLQAIRMAKKCYVSVPKRNGWVYFRISKKEARYEWHMDKEGWVGEWGNLGSDFTLVPLFDESETPPGLKIIG